jgi:hypothetical protein
VTTFALIAWPLLILVLARRLPLPQVILVCLIGGYLVLPTRGGWNWPLLPTLDKDSIPAFTALLVALAMYRPSAGGNGGMPDAAILERPGWIPRSPVALVAFGMLVIGAFLTVATNGDRLVYGATTLPGLRPYDAFSIIMLTMVSLIPLLLGRKFFAHPERHRLLLHALVIAGLVYSFLALYEIRMSPQFNNMVYGFFPHDWAQHRRSGGWRPVVFLNHALALAIFFAMTILAAFGSARIAPAARKRFYLLAGGWLLMTLVLSNSLGALIIVLFLLPFVFMVSVRGQIMVASVIAVVALTYPALRHADVIPTERLVSTAAAIDEGRSLSLAFRFRNEDALLEHARERPLFGWGTSGRNRIYDERGRGNVVTDGLWIVSFGKGGWVGYLSEFALLTVPLILLALRTRRQKIEPATAFLGLVMAAQLIDLLPNGFISPIAWLIAGAFLGRLEYERVESANPTEPARAGPGVIGYARSTQALAGPSGLRPTLAGAGAGEVPTETRGTPIYSRQTRLHRRSDGSGQRQRG